jgi:hypothetical protein
MKTNWKRLFIWSSLGGLAVGATVALSRKPRKVAESVLTCRKIPTGCPRILIWTSLYNLVEEGRHGKVRSQYVLQTTPFRVWSILDLTASGAAPHTEGSQVYHIAHWRLPEDAAGGEGKDEPRLLDRFYATVRAVRPPEPGCDKNFLARGGFLELNKCRVGGASNGVETGELHLSASPILNFRFEFEPAASPASD